MASIGVGAATCLLVAIVLVAGLGLGVWWARARRAQALDAPHALGQAMGLEQVNEGTAKIPTWYRGSRHGRDFAVTFGHLEDRRLPRGARNPKLAWRLLVPVLASALPEVVVYRRHDRGLAGQDEPFDAVFGHTGGGALPPAAREALLAFARTTGGIRLRPRAGTDTRLVPPQLFPDAPLILLHDRLGASPRPDEVLQAVDALVEVARTLEPTVDAPP